MHVDQKPAGNQYQIGAKGGPGEKTDCSGLLSDCVIAGGEKDPNYGNESSGVLNIENNSIKVSGNDAVPANIITFRKEGGYPYHTGIVKSIERDEGGNIISVTYIHSSGGVGPNEATFNVNGDNNGLTIHGFYKWDTKPDPAKVSNVAPKRSSINTNRVPSSQIPDWAEISTIGAHIYFIFTGIDSGSGIQY